MRVLCKTLIIVFLLSACGATRKISEVGLREPASVVNADNSGISDLREGLSKLTKTSCSSKFLAAFKSCVLEKLSSPGCPDRLASALINIQDKISLEEKAILEPLITGNCGGLLSEEVAQPLKNFLETYSSSGPLGRYLKSTTSLSSDSTDALKDFKALLQRLLDQNLALDIWLARNGSFLIPENKLYFFKDLFGLNGCAVTEDRFNDAYETLKNLEELLGVLPEGSRQKNILQIVVDELQLLFDRRVMKFFGKGV